jgi:DNA-binding NarL/FixJ family response regulator
VTGVSPPVREEPPLRVLVADDDPAFRRGLQAVLQRIAGVEPAGSASDGLEAVRLFSELRPDAVLMDLVMPRCDGIEATRQIIAIEPRARVIVLAGGDDLHLLPLCLAAGARGCLRKSADSIGLVPIVLALGTLATATRPSRRRRTR